MTFCPICSTPMHGTVCSVCAYDLSRDVEAYGSLCSIRPGRVTMSVISIRTQWQRENSDLVRCPSCEGTLFGYHKDSAVFRCRNCGASSEHKQLRALQSELQSSSQTVRQLQEELSALHTERYNQTETISNYKRDLRFIEKERNKALSDCEELRKKVKKLEKALLAAEDARKELLKEKANQKETISKLLVELQQRSQKSTPQASSPFPLKPYRQHQFFASTEKRSLILHEQNGAYVVTQVLNGKHTLLDPKKWSNIVSVAANSEYGVGLKKDGTVVTTDDAPFFTRYAFPFWSDIVAIASNGPHTVGLKSDGTVVAAGATNCGQCNVSGWKNILSIAATSFCTYGLQADGTVVTTGNPTEVSHWRNIVALSASPSHLVGLCANGTVVATGSNADGRCNVEQWSNIIAIATGVYTMGLKKDGTIVFAGNHDSIRNILNTRKNVTDIHASGMTFFTYDSSPTTNPNDELRRVYLKNWVNFEQYNYVMPAPERIPCLK